MHHLKLTWTVLLFFLAACPCWHPERLLDEILPDFHESPHKVCVLERGGDAWMARLHLIRSARERLSLMAFIWTDDRAGRTLAYELLLAAQRGVSVQILVDQMFSTTDPARLAGLAAAHPLLKIKLYNPNAGRLDPAFLNTAGTALLNFRDLNQRMHNKILVADGRRAITGGRNIEETYFDMADGLNYRDRDILVEGPVIASMIDTFDEFWAHPLAVPADRLTDVARLLASSRPELPGLSHGDEAVLRSDLEVSAWGARQQWVTVPRCAWIADHPGKNQSPGLKGGGRSTAQIATLLTTTRQDILLQTPYLVLSPRAQELFATIRDQRPGITLTVSTNSLAATDSWPTYAMALRQKRFMLDELDFHIHEFRPRPGHLGELWTGPTLPKTFCLHAKSFVLDGRITGIGSYNLDPRSANLNTEVMLILDDPVLASRVGESIRCDCAPEASWIVAPVTRGLLDPAVNVFERIADAGTQVTGVDLWPLQRTQLYELNVGGHPVPPGDPAFHDNWRGVGRFPELPFGDSKRVLSLLFKALGAPLAPIL